MSLDQAPEGTGGSESSGNRWTVARVLEWMTSDFVGLGLDSPRLDAELLAGHVLGLERIELYLQFDRPLSEEELAGVRQVVRRRRQHEPVAYIRQVREFFGRPFFVDARVLIPRPETELLVEQALAAAPEGGEVLDLCTGSGAVALTMAAEREDLSVTGADVSSDALRVAQINATSMCLKVSFERSDLFGNLSVKEYDVITANPPYLRSDELHALMPDVREHEPRLALDGGEGGMDFIQRIAREAPKFVCPGGLVAIEVGQEQARLACSMLASEGWLSPTSHHDLAQIPRVVTARRP